MSLERVIAEQQSKIDRQESRLKHYHEQTALLHKQIEKRFSQLDTLVTLSLRDCWRDDKKKQWEQYCRTVNEVKISMIEYGYCFNCQSFLCECNWAEE